MRKLISINKFFLKVNTSFMNLFTNKKIIFLFVNKLYFNLNFFLKKKNGFNKFFFDKNLKSKKNINFLWLVEKKNISTIITLIRNSFINSIVGWSIELEMIGLGFRLILMDKRKIPYFGIKYNKIRFDGGYSHLIDFNLSSTMFIKKKKRRNFILFAFSIRELHNFLQLLTNFRPVGPYKIRGLKIKGAVIKLKPGKNK